MLKDQTKELEEKLSLYEWRDIKDAPKDKVMFITFKNSLGKDRVVKALYEGKYEIEDEVCIVCGTKINVYWIYTREQRWKTMKEVCLTCKQRNDDERKLRESTGNALQT